jgi:poly-gamma-glutamate synthesis protein (capsule biosynthesis protein)
LAAFLFFSFLSRTAVNEENEVLLFFDASMEHLSVIRGDITQKIEKSGVEVCTNLFHVSEIDQYIMVHPEALFITGTRVQSELYRLKEYSYKGVKVVVTNRFSEKNGISKTRFHNVIEQDLTDEKSLKRVEREKIPFCAVSFQDLDLHLKPLPVDGVFPDLDNIKKNIYDGIYSAYIYTKGNLLLENNPDLAFELCNWIEKTFTIIAGGDIMLSRGTRKFIDKYGSHYPFSEIRDEIITHDIAIANLECPISSRGNRFSPDKGIYFKALPDVVEGLKYSGFNVFTLANNHILDWGIDAATDTMHYLKEKGLYFSGVGFSKEEASKPVQFDLNGVQVGIICYNDIYPFTMMYRGRKIETNSLDSQTEETIRDLKEVFDILVAAVHTGTEYLQEPEKEKIQKMRTLVDYGVDVVLGTHPHVAQEIEVYRESLIVYSLGNLIFDQSWSPETSRGILLEIAFFGGKPVYFYPKTVLIENARARFIPDEEAVSVLSSLNQKKGMVQYAKQ